MIGSIIYAIQSKTWTFDAVCLANSPFFIVNFRVKRDFEKNLFARQIVLFCIYTTEGVKYFLVDLTISLFYSSREFDTKFGRGNCENTSHQGTVEGDWNFGVYPKRIGGR